jgi:hypothetical protein
MFRLVFGSLCHVCLVLVTLWWLPFYVYVWCVSSFMLICLYLMTTAQCGVQDFIWLVTLPVRPGLLWTLWNMNKLNWIENLNIISSIRKWSVLLYSHQEKSGYIYECCDLEILYHIIVIIFMKTMNILLTDIDIVRPCRFQHFISEHLSLKSVKCLFCLFLWYLKCISMKVFGREP